MTDGEQDSRFTEAQAHRHFGVAFNGLTWELLSKERRVSDEDERMLHAAHASYLHWIHAGNEAHRSRAAWLLSRVYAVLGDSARCTQYADETWRLCAEHAHVMKDWDHAYAAEARARAFAIAGDVDAAREAYATARKLAREVADDEDRKLVLSDLASQPWGAFRPEG